MATRLQWDQIKPDFSNSAASMRNAMTGISEAGTVFDKIRDDIAAEEQAALEAAYKQQVFDENVRQFDLEQAWNRENAEAERLFKIQQAEKEDKRAKERIRLQFGLEEGARNKNTAAYNALNTFFMDSYKKTGDIMKAAEATRAFHNANYGNVLFDAKKIFGNLADAVTQSYSPDTRAVQLWDVLTQAGTAGGEKVGSEQRLRNEFSHMMSANGKVFQEVNGTVYPVPDSEAQTYLRLQNDKKRFAELEQKGLDILAGLGMNEFQSRRFMDNIMSKAAIDKETALLELTSKLGVANPSTIPVFKAIIESASNARANIAAEDKATKEREKLYTPDAYNKAYLEVYDEATKAGNDIFDVSKNPELNASIELLSEAMRNQKVSASEFKKLLNQIKNHDYGTFGKFGKNDDIRSEGLNHPVLKAARDKYLPKLGKPTVEKPEPSKTGNSGVGSTNEGSTGGTASANNVVTPPSPTTVSTTNTSEDLKGYDVGLAQNLSKQLERQRKFLQLDIERGTQEQDTLKRIAYLNSAIANLQNKKAITVSDADAYTYIKKLLDSIGIREIKADDAGNPIFAKNIDLASRLLRLLETPSR